MTVVLILRACVVLFIIASASRGQLFPAESWVRRTPADVGMNPTRLGAFASYLGGCGCVVRHGYMV
ncbi:MAG TPA: hypothetical protein PKY77_06775 [Phycisphaerae bacterium]|nr:hypothetical protein [Phycisphaerae bacterium]HRY69625.1 hypothetical protein [Phycisphaerae bacterium]HSA27260.1 hypothetical protein [Phycisphaerae bacterium]